MRCAARGAPSRRGGAGLRKPAGDAGQAGAYGADLEDGGDVLARIDVEPCALLTNAEIWQ